MSDTKVAVVAVQPTGTCFDDAADFFLLLVQNRQSVESYRLAHGIVNSSFTGEPVSHAWVETGDRVIFAGLYGGQKIYFEAERAAYYLDAGVRDVTIYSLRDLLEANRYSGHNGPWEDRYRRLCKKGGER